MKVMRLRFGKGVGVEAGVGNARAAREWLSSGLRRRVELPDGNYAKVMPLGQCRDLTGRKSCEIVVLRLMRE